MRRRSEAEIMCQPIAVESEFELTVHSALRVEEHVVAAQVFADTRPERSWLPRPRRSKAPSGPLYRSRYSCSLAGSLASSLVPMPPAADAAGELEFAVLRQRRAGQGKHDHDEGCKRSLLSYGSPYRVRYLAACGGGVAAVDRVVTVQTGPGDKTGVWYVVVEPGTRMKPWSPL